MVREASGAPRSLLPSDAALPRVTLGTPIGAATGTSDDEEVRGPLGVWSHALSYYRKRGQLQAYRIGGCALYSREQLEDFLSARAVTADTAPTG